MKQGTFTLSETRLLAPNTYETRLRGDTSAITAPGQFVNIRLEGFFLRRPISVCDVEGDCLTIVYKTVGRGTEALAKLPSGTTLDILSGLGNGYDLTACGDAPLLIGGGAGVPPMLYLAKCLLKRGITPTAILGFNTASELFLRERFEALGIRTVVCTADGSLGVKGFVTDGMRTVPGYSYTYACGPLPMLRAVYNETEVGGEYSFEERMGCGFGACMGCTCKTKTGYKRICKDGPVLRREEIEWQIHG